MRSRHTEVHSSQRAPARTVLSRRARHVLRQAVLACGFLLLSHAVRSQSPVATRPGWHLLDATRDGVPGASVERAYREALSGRPAVRMIIVAVVDGGIDVGHPALRAHLWTNAGEIPANGLDDDRDGRVDDVHGWNFLGGRDGRTVTHAALEVTRLVARCRSEPPSGAAPGPGVTLRAGRVPACPAIEIEYERQRANELRRLVNRTALLDSLKDAIVILRGAGNGDALTVADVQSLRAATPAIARAQEVVRRAAARFESLQRLPLSETTVEDTRARVLGSSGLRTELDPTYDERSIVGDDPRNTADANYGNGDVFGPTAGHGTHVAGIIAALRGPQLEGRGVADDVRVMMLHATTNGDERDKDVANAIRFAVDHGAHIISMSFGKPYSPEKAAVDAAVRYADERGVLIVHSAGNDGADLDVTPNFPTPEYLDGSRAGNWLEVAASTSRADAHLAADFSGFGHDRVDIFAPGVEIVSTKLGGGFEARSGTSQAAPLVAGIAAMLMSRDVRLTAHDVVRILLASATRYPGLMVRRPGDETGALVPFSTLSRSGGVVNAWRAARLITSRTPRRP